MNLGNTKPRPMLSHESGLCAVCNRPCSSRDSVAFFDGPRRRQRRHFRHNDNHEGCAAVVLSAAVGVL